MKEQTITTYPTAPVKLHQFHPARAQEYPPHKEKTFKGPAGRRLKTTARQAAHRTSKKAVSGQYHSATGLGKTPEGPPRPSNDGNLQLTDTNCRPWAGRMRKVSHKKKLPGEKTLIFQARDDKERFQEAKILY